MRNFNTKIDNDNTSAGVVVADEYNSIFNENKNVITPFMGLSEADSQQMIKSIDIVSKAMFYTDVGTVNAIELERGATTSTIETLFDGMVVMFTPTNANTGASTLKIKTLTAKALKYNGADLESGFLSTTSKYIAIYDLANDRFNIETLTTKVKASEILKYVSATIKDAQNNDLFKNLKSNIGYQKLPNGLIVQWGITQFTASDTVVVTLPIAYTVAQLANLANPRTGAPNSTVLSTSAGSTAQFTIYGNATTTMSIAWFSIGY